MFIGLDFDGTVVDHRYPDIGEPVPGAIKWLRRLQQSGARIILFTMRSDSPDGGNLLKDAVEYLENKGIRLYCVNKNPDQEEWTSSPKVYANVYIDDSAFGCPLVQPKGFGRPCVDWKIVGPQVEHMCLNMR